MARRLVAGAGLIAAVAGCSAQPTAPAPSASAPVSLGGLIGDAACETDDQCRTLPVGSKACGGPERYLAWSALRSDGEALRAAAASVEARPAAKLRDGADAMLSTCEVVADPGAYCAVPAPPAISGGAAASRSPSGTCRLRPTTRSGAASAR